MITSSPPTSSNSSSGISGIGGAGTGAGAADEPKARAPEAAPKREPKPCGGFGLPNKLGCGAAGVDPKRLLAVVDPENAPNPVVVLLVLGAPKAVVAVLGIPNKFV